MHYEMKSEVKLTTFGCSFDTISGTKNSFRVNCAYQCEDNDGNVGSVYEHYTPVSTKAQNVFYGQFVSKHCDESWRYYDKLHQREKVEEMNPVVEQLEKELGVSDAK